MEYLNEKEITKELIQRTLCNLDKYNGDYEVTQLINSMLGLLVIPKETHFRNLQDSFVSSSLLSTIINSVESNYRTNNDILEKVNLRTIVRHLRNALSHGRIEILANRDTSISEPRMIENITFTDEDTAREFSFTLTLDISTLDQFVREFSSALFSIL